LLRPRLVPVGSPTLLADGAPISQPSDCLRYPLLHELLSEDWRLWLQAHGADQNDPRVARGSRLADASLLVRAAVAGQGLALLRDTYVADEVAAGRLRIALDAPWPARFAYYCVTLPGSDRRRPAIASFKAWLLREAASAETGTAAP
jgi:LysR family transcriptional regulator, glycine cleavage system transcriptional activator